MARRLGQLPHVHSGKRRRGRRAPALQLHPLQRALAQERQRGGEPRDLFQKVVGGVDPPQLVCAELRALVRLQQLSRLGIGVGEGLRRG